MGNVRVRFFFCTSLSANVFSTAVLIEGTVNTEASVVNPT